MSWSISTHNLTCIRSYEAAKAHFEGTEQPKTRNEIWGENERPLEGKREYHKRMEKDDRGYHCSLYRTRLVSYLHNGDVQVAPHDTVSSRSFLDCVTPLSIKNFSWSGGTMLCVDTPTGTQYLQGGLITFTPAPDGLWIVKEGATTRCREKLDRKKEAAVRKLAAPLLYWDKATRLLVPEKGFIRTYHYYAYDEGTLEAIQDPSQWGEFAGVSRDQARWLGELYKVSGAVYLEIVDNHEPPRKTRTKRIHNAILS